MSKDKFISQLQNWLNEFIENVISHFRDSNSERGRMAFERWKERFTLFLRENIPIEADRFTAKTSYSVLVALRGENDFQRFMREDGNTCIAFIEDLIDAISRGHIKILSGDDSKGILSEDNLLEILLTPPQKLWLETIYEKYRNNEDFDERVLKVELRSKLPNDFDLSKINRFLLRGKTNITLFGIGLIDPENDIVEKTNKVIKGIQKVLEETPKIKKIQAKQIADSTELQNNEVEEIFERLSRIGLFHHSGINGENGWSQINIEDDTFDNYLKHENIAEWLQDIASRVTEETKEKVNINMEKQLDSKKVFIVHGHDDAAKEAVARFVEKLSLDPIILHEQPNGGKTIIEKFEHYSDVVFAIVILTPDDLGCKKDEQNRLKPRARQNVIFELGYFFAKLTRGKVCALYKEGLELPSDVSGVLYVPMDNAGAWKGLLAREMREAGLDVDMNKIY